MGDGFQHRRGLSDGSVLQDRDEDLALFQDMRTRENNDSLNPSTDDIDESLSIRLRRLLDTSTQTRKNDYNWLLTPPGTPHFPSLKQDAPCVNISETGALRNGVISVPQVSSRTTSRGNSSSPISRIGASPRRSSTTCSSGPNTYSQGRASSSQTGNPKLQPLTSSGRLATSSRRSSTPPAKSLTTALRRSSTSPHGHLSSAGRGGYSPQKNRHGCSSSPKIRPWQSGIPDFLPEPPPNLRTTLSDLSTSRSRRLCPASRHGEDTGNKPRGHSVSPRISRLANSSNNYDSDRLSSYSKSSVVSSCEDEIDSISSATSVKKIAYTKNTVHHQVTRKKGSNANSEAQSTSKKQVKPSATNVSSGSGSTVWQSNLRQNSKSMFRPLMSSAPVASFYTYKRSNFLHQGSSINSSVTTSSNASSEQGARVAPYTEAGDHDIADVSDESRECLTTLCPKEIFAFNKTEMKVEDAERHCVDSSNLSQKQRDCLELEQISYVHDLHSDSYEQSSGKPDTGNLGKPLLDGNESVKRIPSVTGSHGYDCYQDGDMGHTQKDEHGDQIDEHREVCLYFKKDVIHSNDEYLGRSIVDMQEDNASKFMSIKNVSDDGISENLQASLLRNFEIAKMRKHDLESRKYVIMHEATKNQVKETDCHTMCFQDQFSAGQMTGSNNMNLMSKFKKVEEITHCEGRGNVRHQTEGVDFPSQHMPGKDAGEHNVEHSPECVSSGELPSKVKTAKESVLQVEAISSINLCRDCFHLRSCGNDVMKSVVYSTCNSVPCPGSIEQTGTTDLCQTGGRKIDLENITSTSSINVLTGLNILSAEREKSTYQTSVCSEKVPTDYFQNILEMPSTVEANTLDHTACKIPPDNLVNSAGISSIYTVSDLNSPPSGSQSQTHQAPIHNENASGNPCTNYYLDVPEMTSTMKTKALKHTESASKGLTGELADIMSISSIDMFSGLNIPTAKVQNNAYQTLGHSENVSEKALNDYCPDVFEITRTVKTNTLVHSAAASKGVSIPTVKLQSNAHQTPGHSENVSEKTYIDYCPDVFEITRIVKTKTLEQSVAASKGLPGSIQGGDLLSLPEEASVCVTKEVILPMPESNLVAEVDAKINKDVEVETSNQKENMLCNDALSPEKQDHIYACTDSFKQSEKFGTTYIKIRSKVVREANKLAAGSLEQEMKSTSDDDLQTDMTECSIQAFPDSIVLNGDAIAHERKLVGLREIQINIQHEAVTSTNELTVLHTDDEPFASVASERYNFNQNDDAESKDPSYHDSPGHAHYFQDNSGVDTDAPTASLSRSLALAGATDTVLLCSTIVHNLIDKATNIGMEKENVIAVGNPSTSVTLLEMPAEVQRNLSVSAAAPHASFKPKKTKSGQAVAGHRVRSNKFDNNIRHGERVLQVVVIPQRDAIAHERKRKWKCCCTIM